MGAGMTATLPPASLRVGAVGGIFVVSDETKRPDEAAMRRILERYSDSQEAVSNTHLTLPTILRV